MSSKLTKIGNEVLEWANNCLENDTFPRSDYRELVELTLLFWEAEFFHSASENLVKTFDEFKLNTYYFSHNFLNQVRIIMHASWPTQFIF